MSGTTPAAAFDQLARSCHLPDKFRLMLIHLMYGTIPLFASIDSGLCVPAPTAAALQEVVVLCSSACPALQFDADDLRRLRGFAMSCHFSMVQSQQQSLQVLGLTAPTAPATPTTPSQAPGGDGAETEKGMAGVAAQQWEADRRVRNEVEQVPRSEQIGDKHVYHWFTDAANHYALRHFPELLRLKSGAATRVEHTHSIGEGLTIRLDTQDSAKEPVLVATCLSKALLFLTGISAAWNFIIDDASQYGAIPGQEGYRVTIQADGTEVRTRYFAVTFAKTFYNRFVQASIDNDYDALPGIFHAAMVRIGDFMGQGRRHADTACKLVCEEHNAIWLVPKAAAAAAGGRPNKAPTKPSEVEQRTGRCFVYDNKGYCPKKNLCPFRGSHNPLPASKRREGEYHSDDDRRGSSPRRNSRRDDDRRDDHRDDRHSWRDKRDTRPKR